MATVQILNEIFGVFFLRTTVKAVNQFLQTKSTGNLHYDITAYYTNLESTY